MKFEKEYKGETISVTIADCYKATIEIGDNKTHGTVGYSNWYPVKSNGIVDVGNPAKIGLPKNAAIKIPENAHKELLDTVEKMAGQVIDDLKSGKRTIDLIRIGHDTQAPHLEIKDLPQNGPLNSASILDRIGAKPKLLSRETLLSCGRDDRLDVTEETFAAIGRKMAEKAERAKRESEIFATALETAKKTGEKVELARWNEFDNRENCVVNCYRYVTPEGKTVVERILTY